MHVHAPLLLHRYTRHMDVDVEVDIESGFGSLAVAGLLLLLPGLQASLAPLCWRACLSCPDRSLLVLIRACPPSNAVWDGAETGSKEWHAGSKLI